VATVIISGQFQQQVAEVVFRRIMQVPFVFVQKMEDLLSAVSVVESKVMGHKDT
jgi:hypothetical protein